MHPKKHPDYDPVALTKEMITRMAEAFGRYDDRMGRGQQRMTLNEAAAQFGITSLKARKILITAGVYSTAVSREVQDLYRRGRSVAEIGRILDLSRASVHSYLPYSKKIYKMERLSAIAERELLYWKRKKAKADLARAATEENLWSALEIFQGYPFHLTRSTDEAGSKKFTYRLFVPAVGRAGASLILEPDGIMISMTEVLMVFDRILKLQNMTENPEQFGIPYDGYLYAILLGIGLIRCEGGCGSLECKPDANMR